MSMNRFYGFILSLSITLSACQRGIYPPSNDDILRDGVPVTTIDLNAYRSVQMRKGQQPDCAVVMAISGGGCRAANFAMGVMLGLEAIMVTETEDALDQVDYFSTVSGGGFAAGAYIGALYEHYYYHTTDPFTLRDYVDRNICDDLSFSYAGVLLRANINPLLWFTYVDDGDALEKAIDDHILGYHRRKKLSIQKARSILLGDLFIPADSINKPVLFPMQFTNSSIVSKMAILPFSPSVLECYQINGFTHRMQTMVQKTPNTYKIPLAVGIKASGSYPVLISNSTLRSSYDPQKPFLHLMDGAMTDNIGAYTALEILRQDHAPQKVLMIVDADNAGNRPTFTSRQGAINSLRIMGRLASSGLDARRITLEQDLRELGVRFNFTPVFFSFNVLLRQNDAPPQPIPNLANAETEMIALLRSDRPLDHVQRRILYQLLTHIETKYTIKEREQDLLLLAGEYIAKLQKKEILLALKK